MGRKETTTALAAMAALAAVAACTPTVRVEVPDKPIEINLNVNIRQEVVVKLERDVQETLRQNRDIF